jgi:MFS family permease
MGSYGLIQGIMQLPLGRLSDKIGRKSVITIGSLFLAFGLAIASMASNIYILILARVMQGFGAIAAVCFSWIGDNIEEKKRNRSMSIVGIFNGLAAVIGFVGGPLLYNIVSVPQIFAGCAVFVLLSWIYILIFVKKDQVISNKDNTKINYVGLFKNKLFLGLSFSAFLMNYLMVSIFYIVPILLEKLIGTGQTWEVLLPATAIGIAIMQISSRMADKGKESLVAFLSFIFIAVSGLCLLVENFRLIFIGTILFMCGYMSLNAVLPGSVTKLSTNNTRGGVTGVYNTVQYIGSFVGGILSGSLWGINSFLPAVSIIIISIAGAVVAKRMKFKVGNDNELELS